jgi:hypothetical protein
MLIKIIIIKTQTMIATTPTIIIIIIIIPKPTGPHNRGRRDRHRRFRALRADRRLPRQQYVHRFSCQGPRPMHFLCHLHAKGVLHHDSVLEPKKVKECAIIRRYPCLSEKRPRTEEKAIRNPCFFFFFHRLSGTPPNNFPHQLHRTRSSQRHKHTVEGWGARV